MSAIVNSQLPLHEYHPVQPQEQAKKTVIQDIVERSLKELAVIALFTGVTLLFVPTLQAAITLTTLAISVFAINTILRMTSGFVQSKVFYLLQGAAFAELDSTTRNVLVHEFGHAGAACLFYQDPNPRITVYPLEGGATRFYVDRLTPLGRLIGPKAAEVITTAAGAIAAVGCALWMLSYARTLGEDQSELKIYLFASAITSIVQHIFYALSALWTPASHVSHDFRALWNHGIHPLICVFTMAMAPFVTYFWPKEKST